jgi:hypothetical protein
MAAVLVNMADNKKMEPAKVVKPHGLRGGLKSPSQIPTCKACVMPLYSSPPCVSATLLPTPY